MKREITKTDCRKFAAYVAELDFNVAYHFSFTDVCDWMIDNNYVSPEFKVGRLLRETSEVADRSAPSMAMIAFRCVDELARLRKDRQGLRDAISTLMEEGEG